MKQVKDLSINEVETLCRLYNECRLSVLEEAELEYILLSTSFRSDIIDETRMLMGMSHQVKLPDNTPIRSKRTGFRSIVVWTLTAAAGVAMVVTAGYSLLGKHETVPSATESYYVAYVEGRQVDEEIARQMAVTEEAKVEAFMQFVENQKTAEQDKVRQFINHQNNK